MRLFRLLLNYLLFSGTMFFATGATALGGDGGSDAGSNASGNETSSSETGDSGATNQTEDGTKSGTDDAEALDASQSEADPDAPVDLGDGRTVPAKWKSLFDAAKEKGLDKEVRALFFGNQRLAQKFPGGINEAVQLADKVEAFGGLEGLGTLKQDNEDFHADAESFLNTPDKWISETFAANPEACLTAFAHSLDYVSEQHPDNYNHLMSKVIVNDLGSLPEKLYNTLAALKDKPEAQALAKELAEYFNERVKLSQKVPEKKVDAESAKLSQREQKLQTEQEQLRNHTVNSQTIPLLGRQMTTQIEKLAKEAGFDLKKFGAEQPEAAQSLRTKILNQVMSKAGADKTFVRNYKAVMKQGDTQRAVKMMNDKHAAILTEIVRTVARGFGIAKKAGTVAARSQAGTQAGGGSSGAMTKVSAKPPAQEIDWTKTGNRIYDSEAVLKNGKVVTWA